MPLGEAEHVQPAVTWRDRIEPPSPCEHCEARRGPAGIGVGSGARGLGTGWVPDPTDSDSPSPVGPAAAQESRSEKPRAAST